jgi:hypothetical protein
LSTGQRQQTVDEAFDAIGASKSAKKPRARRGLSFHPPRLIAEGVNVDPLGSCMMGARVFPEIFGGLVAIGRGAPTVTPLTTGRAKGSPEFIGPANANVVGSANAIASADVVSFMVYPVGRCVAPVRIDRRQAHRPQ